MSVIGDSGEYGIYCLSNFINGKRYVGQSRDPRARMWQHIRAMERGTHYNTAMQHDHLEDGLIPSVLVEGIEKYRADAIEHELIKNWKLQDPAYGYNIRSGITNSYRFLTCPITNSRTPIPVER